MTSYVERGRPFEAAKRPSFVRANARLLIGIAVILTIASVIAWKRFQPVRVTVTAVVRGKAIDAVYATGTVEAAERVNVKAKTSGSLLQILVKEGATVKKGDLLALIDNPVVAFDLKRGRADLSAASAQAGPAAPQIAALRAQADGMKAELATARTDLARLQTLATSGSVAEAEVDRARSRATQLEATVAANDAQQRALRIDLSANAARQAAQVESLASRVTDAEVRSPLDGVILSKSVEVGEVVTINQTLFKVGDTRSLILEVSVDEADVARVLDGSTGKPASPAAVSLYAFPKEIFRGTVREVRPDANRERKAFLVEVTLEKPPVGLRSGMSAEVNIIAGEKDGVLLAPSEAESNGAVWVVREGRAHHQPIVVGIRDLLRVETVSGLMEGDLVLIDGQDKVEKRTRVNPTVRAADKMAPMPDKSQPAQTAL